MVSVTIGAHYERMIQSMVGDACGIIIDALNNVLRADEPVGKFF